MAKRLLNEHTATSKMLETQADMLREKELRIQQLERSVERKDE